MSTSDLKQRSPTPQSPVPDHEYSSTQSTATTTTTDTQTKPLQPPPQLRRTTTTPRSPVSLTLASTAHLANLLPTGTLLAFQLLTPIFTNNGTCDTVTSLLTLALLIFLALSGFLACFSDSFRASDGQVYYGFATLKGMWLINYNGPSSGPSDVPDLSRYRLRAIDWVHAVLSVMVFGVVALRDRNVVGCLYPSPTHEEEEVLDIVPVGIGLLCSLLFLVFPTRRHGIGYPVTSGDKVADD